jgi:hypothetical protein
MHPECGEDDADHFLLARLGEDVAEDLDHSQTMKSFRDRRIKRQTPQREDQLVLQLEIRLPRQGRDQAERM